MKIKTISRPLFERLLQVPPSIDEDLAYRPCLVTLKDGRVLPHVYVQEALSYHRNWGNWPWNDPGKDFILIEDVVQIEESPERLPPRFANQLYRAGETHMGGTTFMAVLKNGKRIIFGLGNAIDFPDLQSEARFEDIVEVIPYSRGRREEFTGRPWNKGHAFFWCLYADPEKFGHENSAFLDTASLPTYGHP